MTISRVFYILAAVAALLAAFGLSPGVSLLAVAVGLIAIGLAC